MHEIRKNLKSTYNKIAKHFDATRKKPWSKVDEFIKEQRKGTLVLDLASGTGRHSICAKKENLYPIAGDFSISQLLEIRKKDKTIPLLMLDIAALPFKSNIFDSIVYIAAIHHLETEKERIISLEETGRVLTSEGTMLVSAWAHDQPRFENMSQDVHYTWDKKYPRFYHLFKEGELKDISKKAGFHIIESCRVKDNIYTCVHSFKRKRTSGANTI